MQTENMKQSLFLWRELMYKDLVKAEMTHNCNINLSSNENILNPNILMNERHKLGQSQSRLQHMKLPKESKYRDAKNLLRKENSKILMYEKEKQVLTRAIENLEQSFYNNRLSVKHFYHEMEKERVNRNLNIQKINSYASTTILNDYQYFLNIPKTYKTLPLKSSKVNHKISKTKICLRRLKNSKDFVNKNFNGLCQAFSSSPRTEKAKPEALHLLENKLKTDCHYHSSECINNTDQSKTFPTPQEILLRQENLKIPQAIPEINSKPKINLLNTKLGDRFQMYHYWKKWRKLTVANRGKRQKQFRREKIELFLAMLKHGGKISETKYLDLHKKHLPKMPNVRNFKNETPYRKLISEKGKDLEKIEMDKNQTTKVPPTPPKKSLKNFHPKSQLKLKTLSALHINEKFKKTELKINYPVPSFLIKMEHRCKERKERWENIYKRKREMEEEKEKIEKEREAEKIRVEEMKKIEKLNEIKEKNIQKKRVEEERERKRKFMQNQNIIAQKHYKIHLIKRYGLTPWKRLIKMKNIKLQEADYYYEKVVTKFFLKYWKEYTHLQVSLKYEKADNFFSLILLKHAFSSMIIEYNESIKKLQVASDWSDAKFTEKIFRVWLKFVKKELLDFKKKIEIAESAFYRKITIKCFKKWKQFPDLIKIEKEKEMRKRLWRQKIQEFLPDYEPA